MSISKLNPVGYEAKTVKGNTYKKSNLGKTASLASWVAVDGTFNLFKHKLPKTLQPSNSLDILGIKNPMTRKIIGVTTLLIDGVIFYAIGSVIDKNINKKRAAKADFNA